MGELVRHQKAPFEQSMTTGSICGIGDDYRYASGVKAVGTFHQRRGAREAAVFPDHAQAAHLIFFCHHAKSTVICFLVSGGTFIIWDRMFG